MHHGRRSLLGLALLGGIGRVLPAGAATPYAALDKELAAIAADPACALASLSVAAVRGGKLVYTHQLGRRTMDPDTPVTARTVFRIASISKMMTTLSLMRLVEQGRLQLDADVSGYLGFTLRNPHFPARAITLRHLLSHNASLRDDGGYYWNADVALRDVLGPQASDKTWSAKAGPGEFFTYCNLNWGVIGTIMERVTGERFDRLVRRLLLEPLGLHGGHFPPEFPAADQANVATLYRKRDNDDDAPWHPEGPWIAQKDDYRKGPPTPPPGFDQYVIGANATPFSPTGGMYLSAPDMATIMLMLINDGRHGGKQILQSSSLATMFTRQWTYDEQGGNGDSNHGLFHAWGLGNQQFPDQPGRRVVEQGGLPAVGHLGDAWGLYSFFFVDRAKGNGLIALVGGTSTDPEKDKGHYSALTRFQERIATAMYRHAIA